MDWPDQKSFAFTIVDDTDKSTIENVKPVYDLLAELSIKTTKTVWPKAPKQKGLFGGMTCEDEEYLKWLYNLKDEGFEIAFHGVTDHTSSREDTIQAIEFFCKLFGNEQFLYCAHAGQDESMYWGKYRLDGMRRIIYQIATSFIRHDEFSGHIENSQLFWGDLCQKHIRYMRNFVYRDINTLKICPEMPYHDQSRPYVNYWFASSEGNNVHSFCKLISPKNQDSLEREHGLCIVYTHFANDFVINGKIDSDFIRLIKLLSERSGWFAPASTILEYLRGQPTWVRDIRSNRLRAMEWKWLINKLLNGSS